MHGALTRATIEASSSDAAKVQLTQHLEQHPCCSRSRQHLCLPTELNEQPPQQLPEILRQETMNEHTQRKKAEQRSGNTDVAADEYKLARRELHAERSRSDRWRETELQRAERLARAAERAILRRSSETEEQRLLRLRESAERKRRGAHESQENEICEGVKRCSTSSTDCLRSKITVDPHTSTTFTSVEMTITPTTVETEMDSSQQRSKYGSTTSLLMQNVTANGHLSENPRSTVENEEICALKTAPPESVTVPSRDSETQVLIENDENTSLYPYSAKEVSAITNENNIPTYRRKHNEEEGGNNVSVDQTGSPRNATQVRQRTPRNLGVAPTAYDTEENYLGAMNVSCNRCGALFFSGEAKRVNGSSNICCNFDNISIDLFSDFPKLIRSFYTGSSGLCKNFRDQIRSYNALAMASMGAQMDIPRGAGPYR